MRVQRDPRIARVPTARGFWPREANMLWKQYPMAAPRPTRRKRWEATAAGRTSIPSAASQDCARVQRYDVSAPQRIS